MSTESDDFEPILLSAKDVKVLVDSMENPPPANEALQKAFAKRKAKLSSGELVSEPVTIDSINKAIADEEAKVTDPVQMSFLQRLWSFFKGS